MARYYVIYSRKLQRITTLIVSYNWEIGEANIDIPSYCRNLLESSLTVLLGRIDPFRLITVYKVQSDISYDLGKRSQIAIEWSGDIISTSSTSQSLWHFNKKKESFDRALLSDHMRDIIWYPAFRSLNDYIADNSFQSIWLNEITTYDEYHNFERLKTDAMRLFSSFSKGVHSECLIDINLMLDNLTLKTLIKDVYKLCSTLGLASHFVDFLTPKIDLQQALSIYLKLEEMIEDV